MVVGWIGRQRAKGGSLLDHLIEEIGVVPYLIAFLVVIIILGFIYNGLTPLGHGMGQDGEPLHNSTPFDGIYFSIVTVSSLGYGDIQPLGVSKAIACLEVLLGLAFVGIMIAKLTSRRLSHHVRRLFSSDTQRRLEEFAAHFSDSERSFLADIEALGKVFQFQDTPNTGNTDADREDKVLDDFHQSIDDLRTHAARLEAYLSHEVKQGGYFSIAPIDSVQQVAQSASQALYNLGQLVISLTPVAKAKVMTRDSRQKLTSIQKYYMKIHSVFNSCSDETVQNCADQIYQTCKQSIEAHFVTPAPVPQADQPDQTLPSADDPQP